MLLMPMVRAAHPVQIADPWERRLVRLADFAIAPLAWRRATASHPPQRVLLLRLERIGDLVMALDGIAAIRAQLPEAEIDLAVGSWNRSLASIIPGLTRIETLDVPWLVREGRRPGWRELIARAMQWHTRRYDLVVNFEPDIRSNFLAWLSGAPRRVGYGSGGGGAFLSETIDYQPSRHVATNARRLAGVALRSPESDMTAPAGARLESTSDARRAAADLLQRYAGPIVGLHASGGRAIKQWPIDRFRAVAQRLIAEHGATIVLTGEKGDRDLVREVAAGLPADRVLDVSGALDIDGLTALFEQLDLLITGDTGPMHLAQAVSLPTVSIFGPSDPVRYAPTGPQHRVVRIDLPCSPCNRIRRPPARCTGHTPDCLAGISAEHVYATVIDVLRSAPRDRDRRRMEACG